MIRGIALSVAVVSVAIGATATSDPVPLVAHEWGTFTSVAGPDGRAVDWSPRAGPSDLPCFVVRNRFEIKGDLRGTVRMETPVLYFYGSDDTHVSVHVRFNGGWITEWFPPASVSLAVSSPVASIAWP